MNNKQLEAQQNLKESTLQDYMTYLKTGTLNRNQLQNLMMFDQASAEFEKVDLRLEAIEHVKLERPELALGDYQKLLESIHRNYADLPTLLQAEYMQMNQPRTENTYIKEENQLEDIEIE